MEKNVIQKFADSISNAMDGDALSAMYELDNERAGEIEGLISDALDKAENWAYELREQA